MRPKPRALLGVITTLVFVVMGISFLMSDRLGIGALLFVLGLMRGAAAVRQLIAAFGPDEEE